YDPVIYDFCFDVAVPVGENTISVKDTIRGILMDKQNCVCDYEFNIYRIAKIGNKVWTLDDYRGSTRMISPWEIVHKSWLIDFYGYNEYLYNPMAWSYGSYLFPPYINGYIKGYHEANEEDWKDLLMYLGINAKTDTLDLYDENDLIKLGNTDTTLNRYFATNGAVYELFSSYGWTDSVGNFTETYQGVFNAVPKGGVYSSIEYDNLIRGKYAFFRSKGHTCYIISKNYGGIAIGNYSLHY
ncbi:MAG: hypothetical protein MJ069_06200, partial [Salinivirgaceae bacterium]|nr:hypothetical protein [Salinivirgaceae bacterium]